MKKLQVTSKDMPFLALVLLFAGFSLYGVLSFAGSINGKIDEQYASVLKGGNVEADGGILLADGTNPSSYTVTAGQSGLIFIDVPSSHPDAIALAYFKQMGYIQGYDDGTFKPDQLVNRAELFTILTNTKGVDFAGKKYENCFTDVKSQWFATFVCYAKDSKWVDGYSDGSYKPGSDVTVAEVVKIVVGAMNVPMPETLTNAPYSDVDAASWYSKYAAAAKNAKMVYGDKFNAKGFVSRATFVHMLYNAMLSTKAI